MGRISFVLVPILGVALAGTTYWGYQEHQEKNAILIKAENQYQAAFHNLNFYMQSLHDELGKSIALNSRKLLGPNLVNVWRLSYSAQNSVGQLPLTLLPFNKTEEFLTRIGDFSYKTAVRDLEKEPLSNEEWNTLKSLYENSIEIKNELQKVQGKVIDKQLRWMDVETALATEDKQMDNTIIDGFKLIDKRVEGYSEIDFGNAAQNNEEKRMAKFKNLTGRDISKEEAKKIALNFLGIETDVNVKVEETGKDATIQAYDVYLDDDQQNGHRMVEVTKKGGHIVWMMNSREIGKENLSIQQAQTRANRYLKQKEYGQMEIAKIERYDNVAVFTAVSSIDGVRIYSDAVVLKIALDNGEIVGFQAEDYVVNNKERSISKPALSEEEAKKRVNPNMSISEVHLAIIENDLGEEVLCYEIEGTILSHYYRIYINAENGEEEKIEKVDLDDDNKV